LPGNKALGKTIRHAKKLRKEEKYQTVLVPKAARKRAKNGVNSQYPASKSSVGQKVGQKSAPRKNDEA